MMSFNVADKIPKNDADLEALMCLMHFCMCCLNHTHPEDTNESHYLNIGDHIRGQYIIPLEMNQKFVIHN